MLSFKKNNEESNKFVIGKSYYILLCLISIYINFYQKNVIRKKERGQNNRPSFERKIMVSFSSEIS